ncbi:hypothetical protein [Bacillus infantis]|nr:hypothetical protein [Bacillus infantis]
MKKIFATVMLFSVLLINAHVSGDSIYVAAEAKPLLGEELPEYTT